jgi:hypothetical protein
MTNREAWVKRGEEEIWRVPGHREGEEDICTGIYTTRYAGKIAIPQPKQDP